MCAIWNSKFQAQGQFRISQNVGLHFVPVSVSVSRRPGHKWVWNRFSVVNSAFIQHTHYTVRFTILSSTPTIYIKDTVYKLSQTLNFCVKIFYSRNIFDKEHFIRDNASLNTRWIQVTLEMAWFINTNLCFTSFKKCYKKCVKDMSNNWTARSIFQKLDMLLEYMQFNYWT